MVGVFRGCRFIGRSAGFRRVIRHRCNGGDRCSNVVVMHILLRIRNGDAFLVETLFHGASYDPVYGTVVLGPDPGTAHEVD